MGGIFDEQLPPSDEPNGSWEESKIPPTPTSLALAPKRLTSRTAHGRRGIPPPTEISKKSPWEESKIPPTPTSLALAPKRLTSRTAHGRRGIPPPTEISKKSPWEESKIPPTPTSLALAPKRLTRRKPYPLQNLVKKKFFLLLKVYSFSMIQVTIYKLIQYNEIIAISINGNKINNDNRLIMQPIY